MKRLTALNETRSAMHGRTNTTQFAVQRHGRQWEMLAPAEKESYNRRARAEIGVVLLGSAVNSKSRRMSSDLDSLDAMRKPPSIDVLVSLCSTRMARKP
eukprot:2295383-Amphidinium_carterae.1